MEQLQLRHLQFLDVSAASGLLLLNDTFYVIADDELSLAIYPRNSKSPGQKIQLLEGRLPEETKERKKVKPDFESLVYLPSIDSILVVPSGSTPNRTKGALVRPDSVQKINFEPLYHFLWTMIGPDLNIEGTVIVDDGLKLFHRGNGPGQKNLVARLNLEKALQEIQNEGTLTPRSFDRLENCDIGNIHGQNLGITDVAVENPNRIWYIAVAESGNSTYLDGEYLGSVVGCLDSKNRVLHQHKLICPAKPEGLALDPPNKKFYIVTDPDDRSQNSQLLEGDLII